MMGLRGATSGSARFFLGFEETDALGAGAGMATAAAGAAGVAGAA